MAKIALIGYGKMGKEIEKVILEEGVHEVVLKIGEETLDQFTIENLQKADVAIEFTQPDAAFSNVLNCFEAGIPVVVGTTAWDYSTAKKMAEEGESGLFVSPNFSIGVNLFMQLNEYLYQLMLPHLNEYRLNMKEIHHTEKKDAPSGTAVKLAQDIINLSNSIHTSWALETGEVKNAAIPIKAIREPDVPGTHSVIYSSEIDSIEIIHKANSRKGFAKGALRAAEFMVGKKGFYTMKELLSNM